MGLRRKCLEDYFYVTCYLESRCTWSWWKSVQVDSGQTDFGAAENWFPLGDVYWISTALKFLLWISVSGLFWHQIWRERLRNWKEMEIIIISPYRKYCKRVEHVFQRTEMVPSYSKVDSTLRFQIGGKECTNELYGRFGHYCRRFKWAENLQPPVFRKFRGRGMNRKTVHHLIVTNVQLFSLECDEFHLDFVDQYTVLL